MTAPLPPLLAAALWAALAVAPPAVPAIGLPWCVPPAQPAIIATIARPPTTGAMRVRVFLSPIMPTPRAVARPIQFPPSGTGVDRTPITRKLKPAGYRAENDLR